MLRRKVCRLYVDYLELFQPEYSHISVFLLLGKEKYVILISSKCLYLCALLSRWVRLFYCFVIMLGHERVASASLFFIFMKGELNMALSKEYCIEILQRKYKETGVYPKKADFTVQEMATIKSYFGPWPRALEAAGIKEPKETDKTERRQRKRIEAKRARNARRKELKKLQVAEKKGMVEE